MKNLKAEFNNIQKLVYLSKITNSETKKLFVYVERIEQKFDNALNYLLDFDSLVEDYKNAKPLNLQMKGSYTYFEVDKIPKVRLISFCEAVTNCIYSLAELLANFMNRQNNIYKSSFNGIRKEIEKNQNPNYDKISLILGNLEWYKKIREIRTETVHYSSIDIFGNPGSEPIFRIESFRRGSDKEEFETLIDVTKGELYNWIKNALISLDKLMGFIIYDLLLPKYDLEEIKDFAIGLDLTGQTLFQMEKMILKEYFRRGGIDV